MKIKIIILHFMICEITCMYLSVNLIKVDDCITNIYKKTNEEKITTLFESNECVFENHGNTEKIYRELVKYSYYELGDTVNINTKNK